MLWLIDKLTMQFPPKNVQAKKGNSNSCKTIFGIQELCIIHFMHLERKKTLCEHSITWNISLHVSHPFYARSSPVNIAKKYGLQAARMFLWQANFSPSTQIMTSQSVFDFLCSLRPCNTVRACDCSRKTYSLKNFPSVLRNKPANKNTITTYFHLSTNFLHSGQVLFTNAQHTLNMTWSKNLMVIEESVDYSANGSKVQLHINPYFCTSKGVE